MEIDCDTCLNNGNEYSEGPCAGCFRSTGIEDLWEPSSEVVVEDPVYITEELIDEGC